MGRPKTLAQIEIYIQRHTQLLGHEPTAVALNRDEWKALIEEINRVQRIMSIEELCEPTELYVKRTKVVYDRQLNGPSSMA